MSLVLPPAQADLWLRGGEPAKKVAPHGRLAKLRSRMVDPEVNDVRREGPELLRAPRQQRLF
jgi:putative SOS response-associated peptidase YedK